MTQPAPETPETPETPAPEARIAELEKLLAETQDKMLRALAEAQNTRQRAEKERQDTAKFAVAAFARDLLAVADNLRRALDAVKPESRESNAELKNVLVGVEATERELLRALDGVGVRKIDALGKTFDPNLHEVLFEAPSAQTPGTVVQVIETGYVIHERLLRPARVGVAAAGAPPAHSVDEQA